MTRRAAGVGVAVIGLVLAGCGSTTAGSGGSDSASPGGTQDQVLVAAYSATSGAKTARTSIAVKVDASAQGSSLNTSLSGDGVIDFATGDRDLVTHLPTGGQTEQRSVGGVLYTQAAAVGGTPPAKPWVRVTLPPGAGGASAIQDPTQVLGYLRTTARSLTKVGKDTVRGTATTHYRADLDLTKAVAASGATPQPGQPDPAQLLRQQLGRDTLPVDVWVDAQQRVWRLQTVFPFQQGSGSATASPSTTTTAGTASFTEEFYDFGVPVSVQAPPPDQVQEAPAVSQVPVSPPPPTS